MVKVERYENINQQQWRALIERSPHATWFQTPEAYDFYNSVPGMEAFACGVVEFEVKGERLEAKGMDECKVDSVKCNEMENSFADPNASTPYTLHPTPTLKGVIVGYTTQEKCKFKQYFTARTIIPGGPLLDEHISDEALSTLLSAVAQYPAFRLSPFASRLTNPIYIETRNFHNYSRWKEVFQKAGFAYQSHLNFHVDTSSIKLAQSRIGKHRWRYIRLSMRDGAKIVDKPTIQQVRAFYTILQDLYRTKVRTPLWSWEFFERLYYVEHAKYILVELDGKIVGGTACVCLPGKAVYEWYACGLDNCRDDIRPLSVAIWGEMQYAAENGYPLFDFMGAGSPDQPYGVRDFKAEFGGELVEHGRFLCIRKPLLYWIGKMGVKWLKRRK